jgi:hypothetical protein
LAKKSFVLSVLIVSLLLSAQPVAAYDAFVLQTGNLSIGNWHVHYSQHTFSVAEPEFGILRVTKATPDKEINSGFLFLNLKAIPLKHFFKGQDLTFERKVRLRSQNHLNVFLRGSPQAAVTIDIRLENASSPPPAITFAADPLTVTLGDAATLTWRTENAESVSIDNNIGAVALSGSIQVSPNDTTTYILTATGHGGTATAKVTVAVSHLPPVVQFSATPDSIVTGETSLLTWSSDWAESCMIEPDIGVVGLNGSLAVAPSQTTTYKLIAIGKGGETSVEAKVTVTDPAPIVDILTSNATITIGESATLSWNSQFATSCTIEPDIGTVAPNGSLTISPTQTTTFTITAVGTGGTNTDRTTIAVQYPVPSITFSASPTSILLGQISELNWSSTYADTLQIDQNVGVVNSTGAHSVSPAQTTTYTLTATGPGGSSTAQVTILVTYPLPAVDLQITPDTIILRDSAILSWTSANAIALEFDNGIGAVGQSGSRSVSPATTTTYTILATGAGGATVTDSVTLTVNTPAPVVSFAANSQSITVGSSAELSWNTTLADTVTIEPGIGSVSGSGNLSVSPAQTTTYTLTATGAGGTTTQSVTVTVFHPPSVTISASAHTINEGQSLTLAWNAYNADNCVIEPGLGTVPINGTSEVFPVQTTTYIITATGSGSTATASVEVVVHALNRPPDVILEPASITIAQGQSATLTWNSTGANAAYIDNGIGSMPTSGTFTVMPEHTTTYTLAVTGSGGLANAQAIVHVSGSPDEQPEGTFGYLYNDLIPEDATIDFYDEKRFALVTGIVQDVNGQPIEAVLASIHNHPEYGTALTDAQGQFSLPVEGGGVITVVYRKQGLISSSRQVNVPWNDIAIVDTVTLLAEDPVATTVTFDGNPETVVTHRSTPLTDEFGTRSATLVFTGDNRAYLTDENGSTVQALNTITTRTTVYATPDSMPAVLPPNSGFTYCVELAVDGAQRVKFSKPVIAWFENYLGFDVGEIVPLGYYDRDRSVWVPSDNGKVVRLLDTDGDGTVDALDANGDNQPDDLNGNGTFADEVSGLGDPSKYAPNATFWLVAVTHFTPWDCN